MADIALGTRRKITWWPFLALGLGLVLLIGILLTQRDEGTPMQVTAPKDKPTQGAYAGSITDLAVLIGPTDRQALIGRDVALEGVAVQQVLGERTFVVGPSLGQRAVVFYDPPAGSSDPEPRVAPGDTIAVHGVVRALPKDPLSQGTLRVDRLRPSEIAQLGVYVDASTVMPTVERSR